ncbi:MAG: MBOAT family protein [Candidatus Marinimicrobia bacterium]|nr:MBOAT family protein [Candidatus Neomarinimicrobiota bacterium]
MLFNSTQFIIFFPIVVFFYFLLPHRFRWMLLLIASYYFYMSWKPEYLILIIVSTLIDYFAAIQMSKQSVVSKRKLYLILSLFVNLGMLFGFKYFNFFSDSLRTIFDQFNVFYNVPTFKVLLPVGISFYTFQTLSYTIDVYRGKREPEKHLGIFALYVAFFPQLVAGPIERSTRLLPQLVKKYNFDYDRVTDGLKLMLWGFFKKVVIADRVAVIVNQVYNNPHDAAGLPLLIGTYLFAFQIYCDFSGYSDIAIGAAKVFGIDLMQNFRRPYFAKSIREFWQRWHISLSTWFRDYLYQSLGGNNATRWRWYYNIMIVFLISGLWHGANWTFVIWGGLHGAYYLFSYWTRNVRSRLTRLFKLDKVPFLHKTLRVLFIFHIVIFGWIFFRANTFSDAIFIITHLFTGIGDIFSIIKEIGIKPGIFNYGFDLSVSEMFIGMCAILILGIHHLLQRKQSVRIWLKTKPIWFRWVIYYGLVLSVLIFGYLEPNEFIYFQF